MRFALALFLLAGVAFAHGESNRTPPPTTGTQIVPTGGPTSGGASPKGGGPTTVRPGAGGLHTWRTWWAYHRDYVLAERIHGRPVTGLAPGGGPDARRQLRAGRLFDVLVEALDDKNQQVRSAAAVALGKWGRPEADRFLARHDEYPGEGWFTVREAALYGRGLLGLTDNRRTMIDIAGDKERAIKERSLALTSLLVDGTQESADLLVWHLRHHRSSIMATAETPPSRSEQDRRRFAAHLLGFVELDGYDDVLAKVVDGSRYWGPGEQGLAITALGHRKAKDHKDQFFRLLDRRGTDKDVQRSAAIALGLLVDGNDAADVKRLTRFARDSKDGIARNFAVMALARVGGPQAVDALVDFLRANVFANAEDRNFVYIALGLQGAKSRPARDALLAEYRRASGWSERAALAVALGLARCGDAIPLTLEHIGRASVSSGFLPWAALALGLHGDARHAGVLEDLFDTYHVGEIRQKAALGLTLLEGGKAVPRLIEMLTEEGSLHAKAAAVDALALLKEPDQKAIDALVRAYRDDSNPDAVRAMAIVAIGTLGDPRVVPLSALLVRDYNYFIRCLALDEIASYL